MADADGAADRLVAERDEARRLQAMEAAATSEVRDRLIAAEARVEALREALTAEKLEAYMVPPGDYSDDWRCAVYECGLWVKAQVDASLAASSETAELPPIHGFAASTNAQGTSRERRADGGRR